MGTSDAEWPKMGRPPKKMDWEKFEQLCAEQCTLIEIALYFRIDPKTLIFKIRNKYGQTFSNVFSVFRMEGIRSLRSKQYHLAMKGNATVKGDKEMLKHLDKKYAHLQGEVDPRMYGGEEGSTEDHKVDINVTFTDMPEKCVAEVVEVEKIKRED